MNIDILKKKIDLEKEPFISIYNCYCELTEVDTEEKLKIINKIYQLAKERVLEINNFADLKNMSKLVLLSEQLLPNKYITETTEFTKQKSLVDQIILKTQTYLNIDQKIDMQGSCLNSTLYISKLCSKYYIPVYTFCLQPGFVNNPNSYFHRHYFNIIKYQNSYYLVDCTYKQFFMLKRCLLNRLGIPYLASPQAGTFMLMDEERKDVANKILRDGYIKITPNVLKAYLDGFALSYRNGLYYEHYQDFSYTTPYTDNDYWNFLNGLDNQYNYEEEQYLSYQKVPLNNPHLDFTKR